MLILSYNSRGMRGASKKNALKRLFNNHKASVIMIQEKMLKGNRVESIIKGLLKKLGSGKLRCSRTLERFDNSLEPISEKD